MTARAIHWHEGMFLRPHHFQAATRYGRHLGSLGDKWDLHYNWGLRSIELDEAAVANHQLVISALKARLRDGTLVSIPEDGSLATVDLKPAFEQKQSLDVYLAVPVFQSKRANVVTDGLSGEVVWRSQPQRLWAWAMALAPDGQALLTGHEDGTLLVWPLGGTAEGRPQGDRERG